MVRADSWRPALIMALLVTVSTSSAALAQESTAPSSAPIGDVPMSAAPASPASDPEAMALADVERGAPLAAGRYVDRSLGRDLTFDLAEGWINDGSIEGAGFAIVRDEPGAPYLAVSPFSGEVFPSGCVVDGADPEAFLEDVRTIEPSAAAFIDHVSSMPELTVSDAIPVELAGFDGLQVDVTAVDVDDSCMPPWAWLMRLPEVGDYHLSDGVVARIVALDADGQVIVSFMEITPEGDVQGFYDLGMAVLSTLEVGPLTS